MTLWKDDPTKFPKALHDALMRAPQETELAQAQTLTNIRAKRQQWYAFVRAIKTKKESQQYTQLVRWRPRLKIQGRPPKGWVLLVTFLDNEADAIMRALE